MTVRIWCETCGTTYAMPRGATVGGMSAWMRWHSPSRGERHQMQVGADSDTCVDVTSEQIESAMESSRDYDEGQRDAAAYVLGSVDTTRPISLGEQDPREGGRSAFLAGVAWYVRQQVAKVRRNAMAREVSPDAEKSREQPDALDVGRCRVESDDDESDGDL